MKIVIIITVIIIITIIIIYHHHHSSYEVYVFNVTNPEGWVAGRENLRVEEVGPFVYR